MKYLSDEKMKCDQNKTINARQCFENISINSSINQYIHVMKREPNEFLNHVTDFALIY